MCSNWPSPSIFPTSSARKFRSCSAPWRRRALPLGERLIAQEAELDKAFADKTITAAALAASAQAIGATHAALRQAHLKYHLFTIEVLTPTQIEQYAALRGYKGGAQHPHRQH